MRLLRMKPASMHILDERLGRVDAMVFDNLRSRLRWIADTTNESEQGFIDALVEHIMAQSLWRL